MSSLAYMIRQIPLIGSTAYHAGQLYQIMTTPCATDLTIWVEGFFAYAPTLIWAIIEPQPDDVLVGGIRTGLNAGQLATGRRHSVKRRGRVRMVEVNQKQPVELPGVVKAAWKFIEWERRIGWYLLIADATVDFLLNWTSMVYALSACPVEGQPYQELYRQVDTGYGVGFGPGWHVLGGYDRATGTPAPPAPPSIAVPANTPFFLGATVQSAPGRDDIAGMQVVTNNGFVWDSDKTTNADGSVEYGVQARMPLGLILGGQAHIEVRPKLNTCACYHQNLQVYRALNPVIQPFDKWSHFVEGARH